MDYIGQMEQAYGLWIYTFQMWYNIVLGNIKYDELETKFQVGSENDRVEFTINYAAESFKSIANNNAMAATGICFAVFDRVMNDVFQENINNYFENPSDATVARIIVRQIRNAYTHDPIHPKWEVKNPNHRKFYTINNDDITLSINLKILRNQPFDLKDINNYQGMVALLKYCMKLVEGIKK